MRHKCLLSLFAALAITSSSVDAVEQWGVFELAISATEAPRTIDSAFSATFSQGSQSISVPGFWDGENVFKVRFSPLTLGPWDYVTHSKHASLDGKTGVLTVDKSSDENHLPVHPFETFYLHYADGTPYHQFGTTCSLR